MTEIRMMVCCGLAVFAASSGILVSQDAPKKSCAESALKAFHDRGAYDRCVQQVMDAAWEHVERARQGELSPAKAAVVLDVDDTSIFNYALLAADGFYMNTENLYASWEKEATPIASGQRSAPHFDGFKVTNGRADGNGSDKDIGGGLLMKSNATFKTCTFESNKAKSGGGMYAVGVPIFEDCTFTNNDADDGSGGGTGGALVVNIGGNPNVGVAVNRCNFNNNESKDDAGAVYVQSVPNGIQFINCLFYQNEADKGDSSAQGGALYTIGSVGLINCTLARNQCGTDNGGGGLYHESGSTLQLKNCILWGNMTLSASLPNAEADQIKIASGTATATYTCIQHIDSFAGGDNTDDDPLFESASSDNYDLNPANCGDQSCDSSGIDLCNDGDCVGSCELKDVKYRPRKVNLDNRSGHLIDKGALERPASQ